MKSLMKDAKKKSTWKINWYVLIFTVRGGGEGAEDDEEMDSIFYIRRKGLENRWEMEKAPLIPHHCSDLSNFTSNLSSAFVSHGYPLPLLQHHIHCTLPPNPSRTNPICPLITTCHPGLHSFRRILKESHYILLSDPSTHNLLPCPSHSVNFCHPPSTLCQN